ncbi:MAG: UPF0149 family protein [Rhodocyclaceae bacterium]|jgi:uncharacterized protein|nr:UPF0149 family protein [Rhodocyclaceae bacterium]
MNQVPEAVRQTVPLSEAELDELDRFLASDVTSDETMMIDAMDGYLTAVVLGPVDIPIETWLPGIWGPGPDHAPAFRSAEHEQRILDLIARHCKGIRWALEYDPDDIDPILDTVTYQDKSREYLDGEMWAYGFIRGIALVRDAWKPLFEDAGAMDALMPIYILGADDPTPEQQALSDTPSRREKLTEQFPDSIGALWRFWHPDHRPMAEVMAIPVKRAEPKIGRNDPCPCGSGRKFKKCCGAH